MERYDPRRGQRRDDQSQPERSGRDYEGSSEESDRDRRDFRNERYRDERGSRERYGETGGGQGSWRNQQQDDERDYRSSGSQESDYGSRGRDYESRGQGGRYGENYGRGHEEQNYGRERRYSPDWSRHGSEPRHSEDPYYARNRDYERSGSSQYSRGQSREEWRGDENRMTTAEQRARGFTPRDEEDEGSHYRGYYRRDVRPFSYPGGSGALYMESWTLSGPYSGRGPKGYKRSDQQIIEEACQRLERDGQIDASEIEVTAEDGIIRLRGTVPERSMKRRAEECVESVYGAHDVMNELRLSAQRESAGRGESSQGSRTSQRSQATRKSQGSQSTTSTSSGATGGSASSSEQDEDKSQKH